MGIPDRFGITLIGGFVSAMLYGIATLQSYVYYMHNCGDASATKLVVAGIWILDTLHVSFMCHFLYYYLIINYGIPSSLVYTVWSFQASILVHVIVVTAVQCFFVHQIYCLCRPQVKWLVTVPIMLLILTQAGLGVATVVQGFLNTETSALTRVAFYIGTPALVMIVLSEVLITVSLCILLCDCGSRSVLFSRTKRLLNTLIIYAVNRCLLTSLATIAELAVTIGYQNAWIIALNFIVQGLYSNSLLASLNTRQYLRSQASGTALDLRISTVAFASPSELQEHAESSKDGTQLFSVREGVVIDITADPATALRREAEV